MQTGSHITRQQVVKVLVLLLWAGLFSRLAVIQVFDHHRHYQIALDQRSKTVTLRGGRGTIYDTNGVRLAMNMRSASYALRSKDIVNPKAAARALSKATGIPANEIRGKIDEKKMFQWLVRQVDKDVEKRIDKLQLAGVEKLTEPRRYYPLGPIASHVIGWTDIDGLGIEGCELRFNSELSGRDGRSVVLVDARQRVTPSLEEPIVAPRNGCDVTMTIDWRIQEIAEEELAAAVEKWKAVSGGVIVVDTGNGDILAMANMPRFDPNHPGASDPEFRRNRLVTDMIEPGSTFKIVAFAEALESEIIAEQDSINCENGKYRIGRHTINDTHELGMVPASDVLVHSSNIGMVKIADRIGKRKLYERARKFGFGTVTGCDVPDESPGLLRNPRTWSNLSLPTISFGQGVSVSPLQLSMAYAAVANGGYLFKPRIIRSVRQCDGTVETIEPQVIRRAVSEDTANRLAELLCQVVEEGTGESAQIPNIRLAGKTGTAQRVIEGTKGYAPGLYISSFIGFVADRDPRLLCFVMVDSPKGVHYGSQVAAPVFRNIINRVLNMGDNPWAQMMAMHDKAETAPTKIIPDVNDMDIREAVALLERRGFTPVVEGDSTAVVRQFPLAGAEVTPGTSVKLYAHALQTRTDGVRVPNLKGKTLREAVQQLVQSNLKVSVEGSGVVKSQSPKAGTVVTHGTLCKIACNKR